MSSGSVRRVSRQDIQLVSCSSGLSFDGTYYRSSTYDCHLYFLCTLKKENENKNHLNYTVVMEQLQLDIFY